MIKSNILTFVVSSGLTCAIVGYARENQVTFAKDVAPIIFEHCAVCHRPGEAGPFSLLTYDDVRKRAKQIAEVTQNRLMPPWLPASDPGEFLGDRRLTELQIQLIQRWLAGGTLEGSLSDLPPTPHWTEGWQLGKPDLILQMPQRYVLASEGRDVYRNFTIPTTLTASRHVRAVEFRPDNRKIVHHAALAVDYQGGARKLDGVDGEPGFSNMELPDGVRRPRGSFLNWTPGNIPSFDPPGFGWTLEPGQDLVLQTHLKPTGKPEKLQLQIGLYFTDTAPTNNTYVFTLGSLCIEIPAGTNAYPLEDSFTLPVGVDLLAVLPHTHYLGKELKAAAHLPDGSVKRLLYIPDWDFNWQNVFSYAKPIHLPAGTEIHLYYIYDNSASNPRNPNQPAKAVRYGPKSTDEMCQLRLQVLLGTASDATRLTRACNDHQLKLFVNHDEFRLKLNPHDAKARTSLGAEQWGQGHIAEAAESFRRAVRDDPAYDAPHYYLGLMYRSRKENTEARTEFETAIRINPKNAKAQANLGIVLAELGDLDKAEASFREALRLNPVDDTAAALLDELLKARGKSSLSK